MDKQFLKSFGYSFIGHLIIFSLLLLVNIVDVEKEEDVYREVSFVVEKDFPKKQENKKSSLAQKQVVKAKAKSEEKETAKPKEKVDTIKDPVGKAKEVELAEVQAIQLDPKVDEALEQQKEESASKMSIPNTIVDADKTNDIAVTKDIPGGEFGEDVADIRPSKNVEIVGPIVNRNIVYSEIPEYPIWAKAKGIESEVRMKFWVESTGEVVNIDVIQKSGYLRLDLLAKNSLAKWKFTSLEDDIEQIKQWGEIVVRFVLY